MEINVACGAGIPDAGADIILLEATVLTELFKTEDCAADHRICVEPKAVQLPTMNRKWANCSTRRWLTFATRLARLP